MNAAEKLFSVEVRCPECDTLGQSHGDQQSPRELVCPECLHEWTTERLRTAEELIAHLRKLLAEDQDASRRAWYNPQRTLFDIAEALDAFPELVQL